MQIFKTELADLAVHLARRREAILAAWRLAVKNDPELATGSSLPRAQLNDHIPALLQTFEKKLDASLHTDKPAWPGSQNDQAAAHGLHRWQQGYDLREVARELGRLNECMVVELDRYAADHPAITHEAIAIARLTWAGLSSIGVSESTAQYFRLQQIEAAGHMRDLEIALNEIRYLETQRAELWHQTVHDIRGNLGVVVNAATGLKLPAPEHVRTKFLGLLDRNVKSLHHLLEDVMNLARLQAGKEQRQLARVNVDHLMRELCEGLQQPAQQRGLALSFDGPATLVVEGDAVKIRRMAQNLVLNAVKYTQQGGVTVGWEDNLPGDGNRWALTVQDTGPGFHAGPGSPLAGALENATELARESEADAKTGDVSWAGAASEALKADQEDTRPVHQEQGEGIGLSIVKRLADILDASIEVDSKAATGTRFRVLFPKEYTA